VAGRHLRARGNDLATGQVPRVGELLHLYAEFCDQGRGGQVVDAGNRIQLIQYFFVRSNTLLNRLLKAGDLSLYEFKVVEEFAKHESLVACQLRLQRLF
jgi:hypothetical protein